VGLTEKLGKGRKLKKAPIIIISAQNAPKNHKAFCFIRKVKHGVCSKRQTAKMKLVPSLFSCVYSREKLLVFAMNSRRSYSIFVCFIYGLEEKNSNSKLSLPFAVCR